MSIAFDIKDCSCCNISDCSCCIIKDCSYYNKNGFCRDEKNKNNSCCILRSCRLKGCDNNSSKAIQYQIQKLIQKTVRVGSSLYTMNLGSLNAYEKPTLERHNVNWNQMSDRPNPSIQKTYVPTKGGNIGSNSVKHTVTASRPGAQSPGGVGCDIKHNSYDRYLNRLKGKSVLRRGIIPPNFGDPIPFNRAFPIYGNKITKTNIVNNCVNNCVNN